MAFLSVTHIIVVSFVSYTLHYAITLSVSDAYCTRAKLMNGHILMGAPLTVYVKEAQRETTRGRIKWIKPMVW